ncbi:MAG: hypothetical protein ACLSHP_13650 [Coprococcus sp.]
MSSNLEKAEFSEKHQNNARRASRMPEKEKEGIKRMVVKETGVSTKGAKRRSSG